ncbi:MAG: cytochrome P450 [Actinobacteria bacterium]|nr:MAG: cytochrome P450 [Actinomycetota bacterium]
MAGAGETRSIFTDAGAYADPDGWHAQAAALRARPGPVRVTDPGFAPFWAVVHHADVRDVEQRSNIFKNAPHPILVPGANREGGGPPVRNLVGMDDDEHRTYRGLIAPWFLPSALKRRKREIEAIAQERIEALTVGDSRLDFANVVSCGLPLRFINATLGIPSADDAQIHGWTTELFGIDDATVAGADREAALQRAVSALGEYFMGMTARLRAHPDDTLGSVLANAEVDGRPLGPDLLVTYFILLSAAGHDTVATVLAGGIEALARHPDQLALLQSDPSLIGNAVEEIMRWVTPTKHFMRNATSATTVGGRDIESGDWLLLSFASANRDETVFDEPASFDVTRVNAREHLSFGIGPHHCIGSTLARLQLTTFFEKLLPRVRLLELDGDVEYSRTTFVSTFRQLPVRLEVAAH